jgi:hypothetical protein
MMLKIKSNPKLATGSVAALDYHRRSIPATLPVVFPGRQKIKSSPPAISNPTLTTAFT